MKMVSGDRGYSFVTDLAHDAERLLETHTRLTAEIEAAKVDRRYTPEHRQRVVAERQSALTDYLSGALGQMYDEASGEFDKLKSQRDDLLIKARLSDPLAQGSGVQNGVLELEGLAGRVDTFAEFKGAYEGATADPYLRRAFQLKGAAIARNRWQGEVGLGSFERQLEADRQAYYETDESRAVTEKIGGLYQGVKVATSTARQLRREAVGWVGMVGGDGNTYDVRFERLGVQIYAELHPGAGDVHGGMYDPGSTEKWVIQSSAGFMAGP